MQPRKIVFAALAIAIIGLIVLVFLKVRAPREAEVSEDKLAAARAAHERRQAERPALPVPAPPPPTDWEAVRPKKNLPADDGEGNAPKAGRDRGNMPLGKMPVIRAQPTLAEVKTGPSVPGRTGGDNAQGKKMDEVNLYYDRGEYDAALEAALKVLEETPKNVRMLRVAVSSACMMGEAGQANELWARLPERDQKQIAIRCSRYGVTLGQ